MQDELDRAVAALGRVSTDLALATISRALEQLRRRDGRIGEEGVPTHRRAVSRWLEGLRREHEKELRQARSERLLEDQRRQAEAARLHEAELALKNPCRAQSHRAAALCVRMKLHHGPHEAGGQRWTNTHCPGCVRPGYYMGVAGQACPACASSPG